MAKALTAVGAAFVLCFAVLGLLVYLNRSEDRVAVDNLLAESITRAVALAEDRGGRVPLRELTDFSWDRVLVVADGAPPGAISQALGSEFKGDLNYDAESSALFVFVDGERLARFADYRGPASFEGFEEPVAELARDEAVLAVEDLVVRPAP